VNGALIAKIKLRRRAGAFISVGTDIAGPDARLLYALPCFIMTCKVKA
jgi:hypothetical protein